MKALLLVAHGSRRAESNVEIARLAARMKDRSGSEYELIEYAFLELAEPSIPDGIEQCLQQGATEVSVLPYFLARGTHVAEDIPEQVGIKQREHPNARIFITDYLGTADEMVDLLFKVAQRVDVA